jgi:FkbM family methyltransferase
MLRRLLRLLFRTGLLQPGTAVDPYRYLRRLRKTGWLADYWQYRAAPDRDQFQGREVLTVIEARGRPCAFLLCNLDSKLEREIVKKGSFEPHVLDLILMQVTESGLFLDVGANVGAYAIPVAKCSTMEVHCFEPNPAVVASLKRNLDLNRLSGRVQVFEKALGASRETRKLSFPGPVIDNRWGLGSLSGEITGLDAPGAESVPVEVDTIDGAYAAGRKVGLIKIDVQGHEAEVLAGAAAVLRDHRPVVVLEHEDVLFRSAGAASAAKSKVRAALENARYDTYYLSKYGPRLLFPVQWERPLNGDLLAIPR